MRKIISFISTLDYPNKRIDNMIPDDNEAAFRKHRSVITSIIKVTKICGSRKIVLQDKEIC